VIDDDLIEDWPPDVVIAVSDFEQANLVERPPFFYVASARYGLWRLTLEFGDPDLPDELFEVDSEFCAPFGMITTETCDLVEEDGRPKQPWFAVAPVYKLSDDIDPNVLDLLNEGRIGYLRRLTSEVLGDGIWVVDARIEFPIEKSWLVGKAPIRAHGMDGKPISVAEFLARRRDRPVLCSALHKELIRPMRRWIERLRPERRKEALDGVAEVRLALAGSPLDPDGAGLIVLGDKDPVPATVREQWDGKWDSWRQRLDSVNISLLANGYHTYDSLSARHYRESFEIPLEFGL